jgi:hypothetical protein
MNNQKKETEKALDKCSNPNCNCTNCTCGPTCTCTGNSCNCD